MAVCHCSGVAVVMLAGVRGDDRLSFMMMLFFEEGEFEFAEGAAFD